MVGDAYMIAAHGWQYVYNQIASSHQETRVVMLQEDKVPDDLCLWLVMCQ